MHRFWSLIEELRNAKSARRTREVSAESGLPPPSLHEIVADARVDVIVTVFDALDYVRPCLESLRRHPDGFDVRVIVVNDGSGRITTEWLRDYAATWPALSLLEHPGNLGYTRAVNSGLRASVAPWIVILNSDTIVTAGWLAGMMRCVRTEPSMGLVGPLSNAASWQSVPELLDAHGQFAVNELPGGLDPDGMAALVASTSQRSYPRVPLLNGFCILMRREVLSRVGLMDEAAFAVGYGEENDYCIRALAAGFAVAVADDSFVFHAKSKSFGHDTRVELSRRGAVALEAKHGKSKIQELVRLVSANLALQDARTAIRSALPGLPQVAASRGLRVLFLLPVMGLSGGANSVVQEAAAMAALGVYVRVLVPALALGDLGAAYADIPKITELLIGVELDQLLELSKDFDVVVATVYYTMEWVAHISAGNPAILPAYYVQDYEPWFFAADTDEHAAAAASYARVPGALLFAKSGWLTRLVADQHGVAVAKVVGGLDHATYHPGSRSDQGTLRVTAMVRPQTPRRGAARTMRVLRQLALRHPGQLEIHVFGCRGSDPRFLELERDFDFTNHGIVRRPAAAQLLRDSDVFVDLSDYQAFGRTALEAMASGCVPAVPKAGGSDEFAEHGHNALVLDTSDEAACVEQLDNLVSSREHLALMRQAGLVTASRFSVRGAALSELRILNEAALARRQEHPPLARRTLVLVRHGSPRRATLPSMATMAGWKLPSVHRAWRVKDSIRLPAPGSGDVAVLLVDRATISWEKLAVWLPQWRAAGGRLIVHWENVGLTKNAPSFESAEGVRWLNSAADAVTSSPKGSKQLALMGIAATVVPQALDPILWRLGPAARRVAPAARANSSLRVGFFELAAELPAERELQRAAKELAKVHGERLHVFLVSESRRSRWLGSKLRIPRFESQSALVDWLFGNVQWDIALATLGEGGADGECERLQLQYAALGAAIGTAPAAHSKLRSSSKWLIADAQAVEGGGAIAALIEDGVTRSRLASHARSVLNQREARLDREAVAARALESVMSAPGRVDVPDLPAPLRRAARALLFRLQNQVDAARSKRTTAFPGARSKVKRKLDKLRRDPGAFFGDSRSPALRLLRGLFD